jgi:hypothetical protein
MEAYISHVPEAAHLFWQLKTSGKKWNRRCSWSSSDEQRCVVRETLNRRDAFWSDNYHIRLRTSGIFYLSDFALFGLFKQMKKGRPMDPAVYHMVGAELCIFKGCESGGTDFNICASFQHADFTYQKESQRDFTLAFDEMKMRESSFFQQIWNIDCQLRLRNLIWLSTRRSEIPMAKILTVISSL